MEQTFINAALGVIVAGLSAILKVLRDGIGELRMSNKDLSSEISAVKLQMSDSYIKKADFERMTEAIFVKLDRIDAKLDAKADKPSRP